MSKLLIKSVNESFMLTLTPGSDVARGIFSDTPEYEGYAVIVLQVMSTKDEWLVVEVQRVKNKGIDNITNETGWMRC